MEKTVKKLKVEAMDLNGAMPNQEQILSAWNEALAKLREPNKKEAAMRRL